MVGNLKETVEAHRSKAIFQYIEVIRNLFHELHIQTRKGSAVAPEKTAPSGIFCMSGPVAHADDDDDDKFRGHIQMRKEVPLGQAFSRDKLCAQAANGELKPRARCCEKPPPKGDICAGSFQQQPLEGTRKYLWSDGCLYEGEWGEEQKTGRGKIYWPSGSTYEGEVMGGNLHGIGTYTGVDGTVYKGNWIMNKKCGHGRKRYANGDFYEGSWKGDVSEGQGRYIWKNGSEYMGDWRGGMMCGRGVLLWASGDKYDGQWLDGLAHGHGIYTWADGGIYVGTWNRGLKDGKGRFYPPASKGLEMKRLPNGRSMFRGRQLLGDESIANQISPRQRVSSASDNVPKGCRRSSRGSSADKLTLSMLSSSLENGPEKSLSFERQWKVEGSMERFCRLKEGNALSTFDGNMLEINERDLVEEQDIVVLPIIQREYVKGILINEFVEETLASTSAKLSKRRQRRPSKERKRPGETIFKGHRSYDLMLNLQLGIRYTVGKITPEPKREICPVDFGPKARIWMNFLKEGSQLTPPHQSVDFKWKDYCPMVFRHLREMFKIDAAEYMLSICGNDGLRELSSPGKSGSVFYLSHDERFILKTLRKTEVKVLLGMLPNYYNHVRTYENTLITKFFGLHRIKPAGGQKVRFIVMGNVVCTDSWIHRRFDLKGSSQGRCADKVETDENTTLKDLDLDFVFHLEPSCRDALLEQIYRDCKFLESEHIMDYSLLLGLHFKAPQFPAAFSLGHCPTLDLPLHEAVVSRFLTNNAGFVEEEVASKCLVLVSHDPQQDSSTARGHVRHSPLKVAVAGDGEVELLLPGTERCCIQLGVNMPARANRRLRTGKDDPHPKDELFGEVYDVVLFFGIIDILQEYDIGKKLEHAYKSFQFNSLSISAVDPAFYSKRFQDFIHQIFPAKP